MSTIAQISRTATLPEVPNASPSASGFTALIDIIMGYQKAAFVRAAADLKLADALADGQRSSADLAASMGFDQESLTRFLRSCAVADIVQETDEEVFALTATGSLLRSDSPLYGAVVSFAGPRFNRMYEHIEDTVRTGKPATKDALGEDFLDYFENVSMHADEGPWFGKALAFLASAAGRRIGNRYRVSQYKKIVDVGGGHGALISALLQNAPDSKGVMIDIPEVAARAREYVVTQRAADRVEIVEGNFFEAVPTGGDLYTIKSVLLDWDDEHAARILASIAAAATPGTPLLLIDWLAPADPTNEPAFGDMFAERMRLIDFWLLLTAGGKIRTLAHYTDMLNTAGFAVEGLSRVETGPMSWDVIEARRV